jgi:hypothetical protein
VYSAAVHSHVEAVSRLAERSANAPARTAHEITPQHPAAVGDRRFFTAGCPPQQSTQPQHELFIRRRGIHPETQLSPYQSIGFHSRRQCDSER